MTAAEECGASPAFQASLTQELTKAMSIYSPFANEDTGDLEQ